MLTAALRSIVSVWSTLTKSHRCVPARVPLLARPAMLRSTGSLHAIEPISHPPRRGLTIIEMMVSLASVMLLMMAYVTLFSDVGGRIGDARSMIELTNRMRSASHRLRSDLEAHTCDLLPWQRPEAGAGYFEIIDGELRDLPLDLSTVTDVSSTLWDETHPILGDTDDVLMFTVRSKDGPFTGKYNGQQVQSEVAEVVWFLRPTMKADGTTLADPLTYTLYRRVFLVMPTYQNNPTNITEAPDTDEPKLATKQFYENNDISVHTDTVNSKLVANTLGDLTKRECRYGHQPNPNDFPHKISGAYIVPFGGIFDDAADPKYRIDLATTNTTRYGEDVVLTNVLAFDVQVWDPTAPVYPSNGVAVAPGDPGFKTSVTGNPPNYNSPSALGAFVDLNWAKTTAGGRAIGSIPTINYLSTTRPMSPFYSQGEGQKSKLSADQNGGAATYDTWSYHYENDGVDQHGDSKKDQGTDGFDNDTSGAGFGIVDDPGERETSPPYPVPLRGIKIRIRCYEPDARQVHEVNVVESFVPQ
jgi:hypothetical protein